MSKKRDAYAEILKAKMDECNAKIDKLKAKSEFQRGYREGLGDNGFDGSQ